MTADRMIRVLTRPERKDVFLSRMGDEVSLDVPGGRVTLALSGGWSESGIAYCHLTYTPIRQGLLRPVRRKSAKRDAKVHTAACREKSPGAV